MSDDKCSPAAKHVAYFMTGLNLFTGILNLIMGIYQIDSLQIAAGIIPLFAGAILLIGIIKHNAKFLLVYLITETVLFALATISGLLLMIVLVTVSARIVDGPQQVHLGTVALDKNFAGVVAFVILVLIIVSWIVHFLMYVFYDDVAKRNQEAQAQLGDCPAVRYDHMAEASEGIIEDMVVFVNKNEVK